MNIVSHGSGMADDDLQLTYIFEWEFPDVEPLTTAYTNAQHALDEVCFQPVHVFTATALIESHIDCVDGCSEVHLNCKGVGIE